ncbi:MAG: NADH-quinone oxidoreductase subunit NuoF [Deltaproteobacteria bacterium]|nr:NADH-quinone oxidoreductase subunit NuoF [Deltaproteobacteria bacterium]
MEPILTKNWGKPHSRSIQTYLAQGGYATLKKMFQMSPEQVTEEAKRSGLRGRGGAGFPAGVKWGFVPKNTGKPIYLCINADESEPGTFKDRAILENDPHMLIEGVIIASYALGVRTAYQYIRGEFYRPWEMVEQAIAEAYQHGFLGQNICGSNFSLDFYQHRGAGAYICGEETGLIESLEGKRGMPRIKPPFPAVSGAFGCPTVVNNVETIAALPWILEHGGEAYAKIGVGKSTGTKLWSVSGHVNRPGVYEVPLGIPFKLFLEEYCGGVWKGRKLKAVIVGGSSVPVLTADEAFAVTLDYESLQGAGTFLGSGGMIIIDDQTSMVAALENLAVFYHHESCGQCTPCREGSGWVEKILHRLYHGEGRHEDLALLQDLADKMQGRTICALADALAMPVRSYVTKFRTEFEAFIREGRSPYPAPEWQG